MAKCIRAVQPSCASSRLRLGLVVAYDFNSQYSVCMAYPYEPHQLGDTDPEVGASTTMFPGRQTPGMLGFHLGAAAPCIDKILSSS